MVQINIPTALRKFTDGEKSVEVEALTVNDAIAQLVSLHGELKPQITDDQGVLLGFVNVFVGDENIRDLQHQETKLSDGDQVSLIPAIAGG